MKPISPSLHFNTPRPPPPPPTPHPRNARKYFPRPSSLNQKANEISLLIFSLKEAGFHSIFKVFHTFQWCNINLWNTTSSLDNNPACKSGNPPELKNIFGFPERNSPLQRGDKICNSLFCVKGLFLSLLFTAEVTHLNYLSHVVLGDVAFHDEGRAWHGCWSKTGNNIEYDKAMSEL